MDYHLYSSHIERSLPEETPGMFGMPANAEIGYLTNAAEDIFAAFFRCDTGRHIENFESREALELSVFSCLIVLPVNTCIRLGSGARRNTGTSKQKEEDDASVATNGGGPTGFTTLDSIRQGLLPSLPARFDIRAIELQV